MSNLLKRAGALCGALAAALVCVFLTFPIDISPAAAAPTLRAVEAPVQPLMLTPPSAPPQAVVVKVAEPAVAPVSVAVPLNEWAALVRNTLLSVLLALWAVAKNKLPAPIIWAIKAYGEQKLIEQAVAFGINAVPGAKKNEPLTFEVGSPVLGHALQWVIDNVPGLVVKFMGGEDAIKAKIFAALHLEPDASATAYGVKAA